MSELGLIDHRASGRLDSERAVAVLKAAAEPTRLRILALLAAWELTVKDLTQVLGQSQPRISRHLKLLGEAGLVDRFREGAWVHLRLADPLGDRSLARSIVDWLDGDDAVLRRDAERARGVVEARAARAQEFFKANAGEWDGLRALHMDEQTVEEAMVRALGCGPFQSFLDLGTGTGRLLELFAPYYDRGVGIDANTSMLEYARSRIEGADIRHAQVRQGDVYQLNLAEGAFDAVVMHQVLHFLSEPGAAVCEAARVLSPGGRLMIVDFAPHEQDVFREKFAHTHLGISDERMADWLMEAGLVLGTAENVAPPQKDGLRVIVWVAEKAG